MSDKMLDEIMNQFIINNTKINIVKKQYEASKKDIEDTGAGFYINFNVPDYLKDLSFKDKILENVYIDINGEKKAAGCLLFIEKGQIVVLEIYTYMGDWPTNIEQYNVYHESINN